jgi:hypothetical protein
MNDHPLLLLIALLVWAIASFVFWLRVEGSDR